MNVYPTRIVSWTRPGKGGYTFRATFAGPMLTGLDFCGEGFPDFMPADKHFGLVELLTLSDDAYMARMEQDGDVGPGNLPQAGGA